MNQNASWNSEIYKNIVLKALYLNLIVTVPCETLKESG